MNERTQRTDVLQVLTAVRGTSATSRDFPPPPLPLQLLLQLMEETPVGALGDELLGAGLDHTGLVQTEGIEAYRILGVVLAPLVVGKLLHGLQGVAVVRRVALVYQQLGSPLRLPSTDVGRFQNGTQRPLGRHR